MGKKEDRLLRKINALVNNEKPPPPSLDPLIQDLLTLPAGVTSINLSGRDLSDPSTKQLKRLFLTIPRSVNHLELRNNCFYLKTGMELAKAFKNIPDSVTSIDLRGNWLGDQLELLQLVLAIPAGVCDLNLGSNDLHKKTGDELALILAAIPARVTSIDLSVNSLGKKTGDELTQILAAIPAGVTSIDLSGNSLSLQNATNLKSAFSALHSDITAINLSQNNLSSQAEVTEAFAVLPAGLTSINLSRNRNENDLALLLAAIPAGVTSIDLSSNLLGKKSSDELTQILAAIPAGVTLIDLSENLLNLIEKDILAEILANLPKNITVNLTGNFLFYHSTREEQNALINTLYTANPDKRLHVSGEYESDIQRALAPLVSLSRPRPPQTPEKPKEPILLPADIIPYILSFLVRNHTALNETLCHTTITKITKTVNMLNTFLDEKKSAELETNSISSYTKLSFFYNKLKTNGAQISKSSHLTR